MNLRIIILPFLIVLIISCAGVSPNIEKSSIQYSKPESSKEYIQGETVNYQLWFDSHKWNMYYSNFPTFQNMKSLLAKSGVHLNHFMKSKFGEVIVFICDERQIPLSYEHLYQYSLKRIKKGKGRVLEKELRTVNEHDVLYMKIEGFLFGTNTIAVNYAFSNDVGSVRVSALTSENLFAKYEKDIFNLLNGLVNGTF